MTARAYPPHPLLAVSTAVVRGGRVLLARRARGPGRGLYSLPGGLVELGETLAEAAARELFEEVAVTAAPIGLCAARDVIRRDRDGRVERHFVVLAFAARWTSGEGTPSEEADDLIWAPAEALAGLALTEGLAEVVIEALRMAEG